MLKLIRNDGDGDYLAIYGPIGEDYYSDGVTAKRVLNELERFKGASSIRCRINSMGGDVGDGFAIYNALKSFPAKVNVEVDGYALSSACTVAMSGDTIKLHANAVMMIHKPATFAYGEADQLRKEADVLDTLQKSIAGVYADRTKQSLEEVNRMMDAETWLTAQEAKDKGFCNDIIPNATPGQPDENPDGDPEHSGFNAAILRRAPTWVKEKFRSRRSEVGGQNAWRRDLARRKLELLARTGN